MNCLNMWQGDGGARMANDIKKKVMLQPLRPTEE